jgi:ABC-type transport system substrate-binding protein
VAQHEFEHHGLGQPAGAGRVPRGRPLDALQERRGRLERGALHNPTFDADVESFLAAASFKDQNKYATTMQKILLHDTPVVFPYFYYYLAAGSKSVKGYVADPLSVIYLSKTSLA